MVKFSIDNKDSIYKLIIVYVKHSNPNTSKHYETSKQRHK